MDTNQQTEELTAGKQQEGYQYTGTVNIWTENGIVNSGVIQAWQELQSTPSYVERFRDGRESF